MSVEKLDMSTKDLSQEHIKQIQLLFPNVVTEIVKDGKVTLGIDFDALKQELSDSLINDKQERYQMTWPDKSKAKLLANSKIDACLRPLKEKSVDFDNTKNVYIEGDNLDVLKLLRETYLGKINMIYIDPPYNTGEDFVYNDDFSQSNDEYQYNSGQYDEQGNRLVQNKDSNGRFHTDWLNMMYPRLKIARDLLTDDGVVFISIDDNELNNLLKICNEIFGESNFSSQFIWTKTSTPPSLSNKCRKTVEYVICYEKNSNNNRYFGSLLSGGDAPLLNTGNSIKELKFPAGSVNFNFVKNSIISAGKYDKVEVLDNINVCDGKNNNDFRMSAEFKWSQEMLDSEIKNGTYFICKTDKLSIRFQRPYDDTNFKTPNNFLNIELNKEVGIGTNETANKELDLLFSNDFFDFPKPISLVKYLINMIEKFNKNAYVLDFFSGSSTTAHAVMKLNAEDGGKRKFIMVQLPETNNLKPEAYKAGYKNICDIGEERIRRAGNKIKEESGMLAADLDTGFRVFKLDSSNMNDVYYSPTQTRKDIFETTIDNIKPDRTGLDLLFQVMLELGVELSAKIEEKDILGKKCYFVNDNDIVACFDDDLTNDLLIELAKINPVYAVFKDSCFNNDSVAINNEQIFKTYSPSTKIKVL